MRQVLIDTDVWIDYFKGRKEAVILMESLSVGLGVKISVLSVSELLSGWDENQAQFFLPKLYDLADVEEVNGRIAELAGYWRRSFAKAGSVLPIVDCLIAATCVTKGLQLVTRNLKHYPMKELEILKLN